MSTENKTKFWVVCCEDTEATRKIATTVADWQMPGVRSLVTTDLAEAETIAQSEYAIFITTCAQPSSQIKMCPLTLVRSPANAAKAAEAKSTDSPDSQLPDSQLIAMHERYGQSPQSWWFQLPTTEVRAQKVQPVATEKSVAQGLAQVEIFARNYTRELTAMVRPTSTQSRTANSHTTVSGHEAPTEKAQQAKTQPAKRKVVLSHYRRL